MLQLLRKILFKYRFAKVKKYISHQATSFFFPNFTMNMVNPVAGRQYLKVGNDSVLDANFVFESDSGEVIIGDRVYIGNSTIVSRSRVELENDIFIAWGCYLYDHDSHSLYYKDRQNDLLQQIRDIKNKQPFIINKNWEVVKTAPIKICSNAWIGMNCIILKGVTVGEGAIVAAGSVVTRDVPAWSVVAGNPAKVVKELPQQLRN